eukprot:9513217-Ditylum_brightwellii.AAC.1
MIVFPDHVAVIVLVVTISYYCGSILAEEGFGDKGRKGLFGWVKGGQVQVAATNISVLLHVERYIIPHHQFLLEIEFQP